MEYDYKSIIVSLRKAWDSLYNYKITCITYTPGEIPEVSYNFMYNNDPATLKYFNIGIGDKFMYIHGGRIQWIPADMESGLDELEKLILMSIDSGYLRDIKIKSIIE